MKLKATLSGFVASSASACLILVSLLAYSTQAQEISNGKIFFDEPDCAGIAMTFLPGDADPWAAEELGADSYIEHDTCYNIDAYGFWGSVGCQSLFVGGFAAVGGIIGVRGGPKGAIAGAALGAAIGIGSLIVANFATDFCKGTINPV